MKMKLKFSSTVFLVWALLQLYAINTSYAGSRNPAHADINFLLNSKSHLYLLKPYSNKEHQTLTELYQLNQGQLLWFSTEHPVQTINQLLQLFSNASIHGLDSADYSSQYLKRQWLKIQQSNPGFEEFVIFDTTLSLTFLRYLHDLHYGRINPTQLGFGIPQKKAINFASHIFGAIQINTIDTLAESMQPQLIHYQQLKKALAKYKRLNLHFTRPIHFYFEKTLHPGDRSTQVSELET